VTISRNAKIESYFSRRMILLGTLCFQRVLEGSATSPLRLHHYFRRLLRKEGPLGR